MAASFVGPVLKSCCIGTSDDKCNNIQSQQHGAAHRWSRTRGALHLCESCDNGSAGLVQTSHFPSHGEEGVISINQGTASVSVYLVCNMDSEAQIHNISCPIVPRDCRAYKGDHQRRNGTLVQPIRYDATNKCFGKSVSASALASKQRGINARLR